MKNEHYLGGRYSLDAPFARGGMATVHLGRTLGAAGFSRLVAIKRLHPQYASDKDFRSMFLDEARLVSRIHHPNVVPVIDVVEETRGLYLVMEYVDGETLSTLNKLTTGRGERMPIAIAVRTMIDALRGLHAAHEARNERGEPLNIVHRDISPQNILVGTDGVTRVLDFGIAKAAERTTKTQDGQIKGKLSYLSPEQLTGGDVTRRSDLFSAGVVLWELLAGARLIEGKNDGERLKQILMGTPRKLRDVRPEVPEALEQIVQRALARVSEERFAEAEQMAECLESLQLGASPPEVAAWVEFTAHDLLHQRQQLLSSTEISKPQALPAEPGPLSTTPPALPSEVPPSAAVSGLAALPPNPVPSGLTPPSSRPPGAAPSGGPRGPLASSLSQPPTTQHALSVGAFASTHPPPSVPSPRRMVAGGIGIGLLGTAFGLLLGVTVVSSPAPHAAASAPAVVCPPAASVSPVDTAAGTAASNAAPEASASAVAATSAAPALSQRAAPPGAPSATPLAPVRTAQFRYVNKAPLPNK